MSVNPYYNISSFIGFRSKKERKNYENVLDYNKNWYDRASYKEFQLYEQEILSTLQSFYQNHFQWGFLVIDSSEAIYSALLIHLLRFKEKYKKAGKPNFLVSKLGHLVFKKAAVLLGVDLVEVDLNSNGEMDTSDLKNKINEKTFCVIGIVGTTQLGNFDDIISIDKICQKAKVPLHVDAAIGGFIFPFVNNSKIPRDFSTLKSALTINVSGHKYGYARPSVGILLLIDKEVLPKTFYPVTTTYLPGGPSSEYGLIGSKPAIGLIDLHYNLTTWKKQGYREIVEKTFRQKKHLINSLLKASKNISMYDGQDTPILLLYGAKKVIDTLSSGLRKKGWQNSVYSNSHLERPSIRIVVRKHFTKKYNDSLIKEIRNILKSI